MNNFLSQNNWNSKVSSSVPGSQVGSPIAGKLPPTYPHKKKNFSKTFIDPIPDSKSIASINTISVISEISKKVEQPPHIYPVKERK